MLHGCGQVGAVVALVNFLCTCYMYHGTCVYMGQVHPSYNNLLLSGEKLRGWHHATVIWCDKTHHLSNLQCQKKGHEIQNGPLRFSITYKANCRTNW